MFVETSSMYVIEAGFELFTQIHKNFLQEVVNIVSDAFLQHGHLF